MIYVHFVLYNYTVFRQNYTIFYNIQFFQPIVYVREKIFLILVSSLSDIFYSYGIHARRTVKPIRTSLGCRSWFQVWLEFLIVQVFSVECSHFRLGGGRVRRNNKRYLVESLRPITDDDDRNLVVRTGPRLMFASMAEKTVLYMTVLFPCFFSLKQ